MKELEKIYFNNNKNKIINPKYRLWLITMPFDEFPVTILQTSIKCITEPPIGIKENMINTYDRYKDFF